MLIHVYKIAIGPLEEIISMYKQVQSKKKETFLAIATPLLL